MCASEQVTTAADAGAVADHVGLPVRMDVVWSGTAPAGCRTTFACLPTTKSVLLAFGVFEAQCEAVGQQDAMRGVIIRPATIPVL